MTIAKIIEDINELRIDDEEDTRNMTEIVKSNIQKYERFKYESWPIEKVNKVKNLKNAGWQFVSYCLDRSPGGCYRIFCSFCTHTGLWTLEEDIQLLSFLNANIFNLNVISKTIATRTKAGIDGRISRLKEHNLNTFELYFGPDNKLYEETTITLSPTVKSYQSATKDKNKTKTNNTLSFYINQSENNNSQKGNTKPTLQDSNENNESAKKQDDDKKRIEGKKDEGKTIKNQDKKEKSIEDDIIESVVKSNNENIEKENTKSRIESTKKENIDESELIAKQVPNTKKKHVKKCSFNFYTRHIKRMIKRDLEIYKDYYENDDDHKNNIKDDFTPNFENVSIQVVNALRKCDGTCPYCHREIEFMDYQPIYTGMCPTAASFDHVIPGMTTFNNDTKLQVICQQCNFGKSNATDKEYRCYLQSIKDFHSSKSKNIKQKDIPFNKKQEMQACFEISKQTPFTGVNTKAVKKRTDSMNAKKNDTIKDLNQQTNSLSIGDSKRDQEPKKEELPTVMTKEEKQFFDLVKKIGYRDPTTGALGIWDSNREISGRFTLVNWNPYIKYKIVTGVDIPTNGILGKEIVLKFTKDVRQYYTIQEFDSWLNTIQSYSGDFI